MVNGAVGPQRVQQVFRRRLFGFQDDRPSSEKMGTGLVLGSGTAV